MNNQEQKQRGFSQVVGNPYVLLLAAMMAGGGTAVGYRHSALSDPYPGRRGEAMEEQVQEMARSHEHILAEHSHFKVQLSQLPPQHLLQDVAELKAEVKQLGRMNAEVMSEIKTLQTMIRSIHPRGHWSPNDIMGPGK